MKIITRSLIYLPKRKTNSKKGDNGRVFVVGGSPEYIGAPALVGIAALRSGCDSVVVAAPEKVAWAINCLSADSVTKKLPGRYLSLRNYPEIIKTATKADCLVIGNGVAPRKESLTLMKRVIKGFKGSKVLDAAALSAFEEKSLRNAVLTPNVSEFDRLRKNYNIQRLLKNGNIIVQKSFRTKIITANKIYENRTGNAGLTKAGTGDTLAGVIAGFVVQSKNLLQSCINGAYFTGLAGDILYKKKKGYFYLASELAEEIERVV